MFRHHGKAGKESGYTTAITHSARTSFSSRLYQSGWALALVWTKKSRSDRTANEAYQGTIMKHGCNDYSWLIVADWKPGWFSKHIFLIISKLMAVTKNLLTFKQLLPSGEERISLSWGIFISNTACPKTCIPASSLMILLRYRRVNYSASLVAQA